MASCTTFTPVLDLLPVLDLQKSRFSARGPYFGGCRAAATDSTLAVSMLTRPQITSCREMEQSAMIRLHSAHVRYSRFPVFSHSGPYRRILIELRRRRRSAL